MDMSLTQSGLPQGDALAFRIRAIRAMAYRAPIEKPVATSFGVMRDRPAVFIRIEDEEGCFGFGEVFANWPAAGRSIASG